MEKPERYLVGMEGIRKCFSGVPVLNGVRFNLMPGSIHVLAGENGAGKSTLIKVLSGVHRDYEGQVFLEGRRVRFSSPKEAAENGISVIHQELSLIRTMSVEDNIFLGREQTRLFGWLNRRSARSRAKRALHELGVNVGLSRPVGELSMATRQLVEIAKAMVNETKVLIMDEPTSALSEPEAERLFGRIFQLKQIGCGIVYITHRMEEIYRVADVITVLRDGAYVGTEEASRLSREKLANWMVGREVNLQFPARTAAPRTEKLAVRNFSVPDPSGWGRRAVDRVSFRLHGGEIVGFAGLQGSGASQLLNGIFGTYGKSVQGEIRLEGRPFTVTTPGDSINRGVALLTNDRKETGLVLGMSIGRNITLAQVPGFSKWAWMETRRERQAAAAQLRDLFIKARGIDQKAGTLSGGNQQKVVFAKWLETRPKVLMLDEPTRGVDVGAKYEIYELMNRLTARGIGILLITSEMPELLAMADRIIVLHRGRKTARFRREEATQEKVLHAAMGEEAEN